MDLSAPLMLESPRRAHSGGARWLRRALRSSHSCGRCQDHAAGALRDTAATAAAAPSAGTAHATAAISAAALAGDAAAALVGGAALSRAEAGARRIDQLLAAMDASRLRHHRRSRLHHRHGSTTVEIHVHRLSCPGPPHRRSRGTTMRRRASTHRAPRRWRRGAAARSTRISGTPTRPSGG